MKIIIDTKEDKAELEKVAEFLKILHSGARVSQLMPETTPEIFNMFNAGNMPEEKLDDAAKKKLPLPDDDYQIVPY